MAVGNTIGRLTAEPMLPKSTPAGSANPPEKKSWWSKWGDVVHTGLDIPPESQVHYLVDDVVSAVRELEAKGCAIVEPPFDIRIGKCAVIRDPFGVTLCILDMTKGPR